MQRFFYEEGDVFKEKIFIVESKRMPMHSFLIVASKRSTLHSCLLTVESKRWIMELSSYFISDLLPYPITLVFNVWPNFTSIKSYMAANIEPVQQWGVRNLLGVSCAETHGSDHTTGEGVLSKMGQNT